MISRRRFMASALQAAAGMVLVNSHPAWSSPFPQFFFAQLKYRGGEWDAGDQFVEPFVEELELRTSIDAAKVRRTITLSDPDLYSCPLLYMAGKYEFDPLTLQEREFLKRHLTHGGFLFAEDTMGAKGFGFDRAFRREMRALLPNYELKRLPQDHSVYQSFYLLDTVGGRIKVNPYLEGITIDHWTSVIYSQNDLSGAWSRDRFGKWVNECTPGGEAQRVLAFKTGINIVVYSLTSDYKKDVIHHPFIQKRKYL